MKLLRISGVLLTLSAYVSGCPYLAGKEGGAEQQKQSILETFLGTPIPKKGLPSLPTQHAAYGDSDLPSLVNCVLDRDMDRANEILGEEPEEATKQMDEHKYSPLQWAAMTGATQFVELFMNYGADPNEASNPKYPPLHLAVMQNKSEAVEALLEGGADVDLRSIKGFTPIIHALDEGHVEIADYLLQRGANVNEREYESNLRIPSIAFVAMRGDQEVLRLLIKHGVDRGARTEFNHTALIFAAAANKLGAVRRLLQQPSGSDEVAEGVSLAKEAQLNAVDAASRTAVMYAVVGEPGGRKSSNSRSVGRPKIMGKQAANFPDEEERTEHELDEDQNQILQLLLEHGADPNAYDRESNSAVYLAATEVTIKRNAFTRRTHGKRPDQEWPEGRPELVETLLRAGALPRADSTEFGKPVKEHFPSEAQKMLNWAVQYGYTTNTQLLLNPPALKDQAVPGDSSSWVDVDLNAKVSRKIKKTLVAHAVDEGFWPVVELLMGAGADMPALGATREAVQHKYTALLSEGPLTPLQLSTLLKASGVEDTRIPDTLLRLEVGSEKLFSMASKEALQELIDTQEGVEDSEVFRQSLDHTWELVVKHKSMFKSALDAVKNLMS